MRKLASVRQINAIREIEGADKIECAVVDGWECVVAKKDNFKVGDEVVYIEIDSIVPEIPEFEFLRERKFRIRTIKLRKQVSQGLIMPLSILPPGEYKLEDDVTEILGITKYDPQKAQELKMQSEMTRKTRNPIIKFLMKFAWFRRWYIKPTTSGFPDWIVKTDEDRVQNMSRVFNVEKALETPFVVTEKLDGCSVTMFLERVKGNKFDFGVCSRNLRLHNSENSTSKVYWDIANQINAEGVLKTLIGNAKRIVLQGEIIGSKIQGNKYKVDAYDFYAFNLIVDGEKYTTQLTKKILEIHNIKTVPILAENFTLLEDIPAMVKYAKGDSVLHSTKREGIVVRNYDHNISFKVINPDFLLAERD